MNDPESLRRGETVPVFGPTPDRSSRSKRGGDRLEIHRFPRMTARTAVASGPPVRRPLGHTVAPKHLSREPRQEGEAPLAHRTAGRKLKC